MAEMTECHVQDHITNVLWAELSISLLYLYCVFALEKPEPSTMQVAAPCGDLYPLSCQANFLLYPSRSLHKILALNDSLAELFKCFNISPCLFQMPLRLSYMCTYLCMEC